MFVIYRQRSRFARGDLKNAIHKVGDRRPNVTYADENAALLRVSEEVAMLARRYRVGIDITKIGEWCHRNADGSALILADPVGVVYHIMEESE